MNHQIRLKRSKRIAEFFVVVSASDHLTPVDDTEDDSLNFNSSNYLTTRYHSAILDRYPVSDNNELRLPQGIEIFCLPNGLHLMQDIQKPLFHSFVHTSDDGSRKLGCCLTFFEQLTEIQQNNLFNLLVKNDTENAEHFPQYNQIGEEKNPIVYVPHNELKIKLKTLYIPKCLVLISSWPFVTSFKKFLVGLYNISMANKPVRNSFNNYSNNITKILPKIEEGNEDLFHSFKVSSQKPPLLLDINEGISVTQSESNEEKLFNTPVTNGNVSFDGSGDSAKYNTVSVKFTEPTTISEVIAALNKSAMDKPDSKSNDDGSVFTADTDDTSLYTTNTNSSGFANNNNSPCSTPAAPYNRRKQVNSGSGNTTTSSSNSSASSSGNRSTAGSYIPIERYICNFIDDVPAPPAGKVDIIYYLQETALSFRCPPSNAPNVWSGLPLFPLFECLSPENICALFALVLTERQILFVSSQYSLLTSCAEGITSLIYPLTWSHAYIPILPYQLLGVLGAPFPFILGLHSSNYVNKKECFISEETVRVLLDENKIIFGSLGQAPPLPDRRYKKLLSHIYSSAPVFDNRATKWSLHGNKGSEIHKAANMADLAGGVFGTLLGMGKDNSMENSRHNQFDNCVDDWHLTRQPYFDDAYSSVSEKDTFPGSNTGHSMFNESLVREGFLKFFVTLFKDYKQYLIYGNSDNPDPLVKFQFDQFIKSHSADWHPLLNELAETQAFSQFIDERVLLFKQDQDVIYFDESIDAKKNRYLFRFRNIDTPFLLDNTNKHVKTYVPPSPDTSGLEELLYGHNGKTSSVYTNSGSRSRRGDNIVGALTTALSAIPISEGAVVETDPVHPTILLNTTGGVDCQSGASTGFPRLNPALYSKPRQLVAQFDGNPYATFTQIRLKRKDKAPAAKDVMPITACVYSCYLIIVSQIICVEMHELTLALAQQKLMNIPSTQFIMEEYSRAATDEIQRDRLESIDLASGKQNLGAKRPSGGVFGTPEKGTTAGSQEQTHTPHNASFSRVRSASIKYSHTPHRGSMFNLLGNNSIHDSGGSNSSNSDNAMLEHFQATAKACKLALKVAFEALNCLSRLDYGPGESVYRSLADACGACGDSDSIIDLLVYMDDQGLQPDHLMLHAVVRALAGNNTAALTATATPTTATTASGATTSPAIVVAKPAANTRSSSITLEEHLSVDANRSKSSAAVLNNSNNGVNKTGTAAKSGTSDQAAPAAESKRKTISPAEVWTFENWRSLQKDGTSSLINRAAYKKAQLEQAKLGNTYTKMFFGDSSATSALSSGVSVGNNSTGVSYPESSFRWSATNISDGYVPKLQWSFPAVKIDNNINNSNNNSSDGNRLFVGEVISQAVVPPAVSVPLVPTNPAAARLQAAVLADDKTASAAAPPTKPPKPPANSTIKVTATSANTTTAATVGGNSATKASNKSTASAPTQSSSTLFAPSNQTTQSTQSSAGGVNSNNSSPSNTNQNYYGTVNGYPVFAAHKKLARLMRLSESLLQKRFPNLNVEFESPFGTLCSNKKCSSKRPLTIGEIYQGWNNSETAGDANKYTTKCKFCGTEFIPRIHITCDHPTTASNATTTTNTTTTGDNASNINTISSQNTTISTETDTTSGTFGIADLSTDTPVPPTPPQYSVWCELLSPWVLRKELLNIIYQDGINSLLDCSNHILFSSTAAPITSQRTIVFWNMLIAFRLRGLPYTFLLTNKTIVESFPVKDDVIAAGFSAVAGDRDRTCSTSSKSDTTSGKLSRSNTVSEGVRK